MPLADRLRFEAAVAIPRHVEPHRADLGETLRLWVRRAETDAGDRPGLTTGERERMKQLERENKELRRANEILKAAASFFGAELDRQSKK